MLSLFVQQQMYHCVLQVRTSDLDISNIAIYTYVSLKYEAQRSLYPSDSNCELVSLNSPNARTVQVYKSFYVNFSV